MSNSEIIKSRFEKNDTEWLYEEDKEKQPDCEEKVFTPVTHWSVTNDNKSLMLDFTGYLSMNSGGQNWNKQDLRSRSYTPTKLFSRSSRAKCTPEELKNKIDEKQK